MLRWVRFLRNLKQSFLFTFRFSFVELFDLFIGDDKIIDFCHSFAISIIDMSKFSTLVHGIFIANFMAVITGFPCVES